MHITFLGAAREVTGSCYLVETKRARILVDCGMFQGSSLADAKNFKDFEFDPKTIDAVAVTHAHLDHTGRLPKLAKEGFKGKIYSTRPTADIAKIILEDAEGIMDDDFRRDGRPKLYEQKDVDRAVKLMHGAEYSRWITIGDLKLRFREAGHIFGSAFIEIEEKGGGRAVFSGDLGNRDMPIVRPTAQAMGADAMIVESTYGNRLHEDVKTRKKILHAALTSTVKRKGVLLIPSFAVERTQDLLYEMHEMQERGELPMVDVYLDTPMGIKVAEVIRDYPEYYDRAAFKHVVTGDDMFHFPGLHKTMTRDQSKEINMAPKPKVIIAGAGMMNGGRILHHLVRYLSDPKSTLLIVGYQAQGTLGRRLYSGEKNVHVLNERIQVRAKIIPIGAMSAHADQRKLLDWIGAAATPPKHVYCTHGEEDSSAALASRITEEYGIKADVPRMGEIVTC